MAVFYKTAGELTMLAGEYAEAIEHLSVAAGLLRIIPDFDCTSLVESTDYMLEFAKGQLVSSMSSQTMVMLLFHRNPRRGQSLRHRSQGWT